MLPRPVELRPKQEDERVADDGQVVCCPDVMVGDFACEAGNTAPPATAITRMDEAGGRGVGKGSRGTAVTTSFYRLIIGYSTGRVATAIFESAVP